MKVLWHDRWCKLFFLFFLTSKVLWPCRSPAQHSVATLKHDWEIRTGASPLLQQIKDAHEKQIMELKKIHKKEMDFATQNALTAGIEQGTKMINDQKFEEGRAQGKREATKKVNCMTKFCSEILSFPLLVHSLHLKTVPGSVSLEIAAFASVAHWLKYHSAVAVGYFFTFFFGV